MAKTYSYSIKLNDETKAKATRIVNKAIEKFGLEYGRDEYHGAVWEMIEEEFPELSHSAVSCHPDMFTVYLLTGSDFQDYISWKQVYDEFNVEGGDYFKVQEEGNKTTCICGQNTLQKSFIIQSKKTGIQFELGSTCIEKHFIEHLDKPNKKIQRKKLKLQKDKSDHFKKYRDDPVYREECDRKTAEEERKKAEEQERKERRRKMMEESNERYKREEEERIKAEKKERDSQAFTNMMLRNSRSTTPPTYFKTTEHHHVNQEQFFIDYEMRKKEEKKRENEEWGNRYGIGKYMAIKT